MGLLSTSHTVVRFVAAPPSRVDRDAIARAVTKRAFRDDVEPDAEAAASVSGWVGIHDPLWIDLSPADLFFHHYLVVGFRQDRRAVPGKLLWLERRRAEESRKRSLGRDRLGAAVRKEIRDEVQARLMTRALPAPRLFDCAWNLETGRVYFTGKARVVREAFQALFHETFGVQPMPMIPYVAAEHVGVPSRVVEAVRAVEPSSLVADDAPPAPHDDVPHLPLAEAR